MNYFVYHFTPKDGLSTTKQASSEPGISQRSGRSPQPNPPAKGGISQQPRQLELWESLSTKPQKPQISSVPGISLTRRNRYRVVLGTEILGDRLTVNEAIELANNGGGKISQHSGLEAIGSILSRMSFVREGGKA